MKTQIWEIGADRAPNRIIVSGNKTELYCDFCHMESHHRLPMRPCDSCKELVKEIVECNKTIGKGEECEYLIRKRYNDRIIILYDQKEKPEK
jgi:hypothetical protein